MNALSKTPQLVSAGDAVALIAESGVVSKNQIRSSAIWLVIANYAVAFVSMGINMVLANQLGASGYGVFRYGIVVGTFVQCLVNMGSHRTIVRDLTHSDHPAAMMSSSLAIRLVNAMMVMFFGLILSLTLDLPGQKLAVAWLCGFAAVCTAMSPKGWFDVQYKMHVHSVFTLAEKVLFAATAFAWAIGIGGPTLLFAAAVFWLISRAIGLSLQFWYVRKSFSWTDGWNLKRIVWLLHETKWVFGAVLGGILATFGTQLVLGSISGNEAMAHFGMAFSVVAMGQLFITQIDRLMVPKIARITKQPGDCETPLARQVFKFASWAALGSIASVGAIAIAGPIAIRLVLDDAYEPCVPILYLLCIWALLYGVNLVCARFLICLRCHRRLFFVSISRGLLAMSLAPVLVINFGGQGVALSMIVSALFFLTVNLSYLVTTTKFNGDIEAVV